LIDEFRGLLSNGGRFFPEFQIHWDGAETPFAWYDFSDQVCFLQQRALHEDWMNAYADVWSTIESFQPAVVFISVTFGSQFLEALALADVLQRRKDCGTIVIGGGMVNSCVRRVVDVAGPLRELVDIVYVGDGEILLSAIAEDGLDILETCSQETAGRARLLTASCLAQGRHTYSTPAADFGDCPISSYLTPSVVLPYRFESVCYWGKCTFCADHLYRSLLTPMATMSKHLDCIEQMVYRHGTEGINLLDSAVHPANLSRFAKGVVSRGLPLVWGTNARFEHGLLDNGVLETLHDGGCRFLRFGLESASAPLLRAMGKGIDVSTAGMILKRCREVGIRSHAYVMVGYPGETPDDRMRTREFLLNTTTRPDSFSISQFILYGSSALAGQGTAQGRSNTGWAIGNSTQMREDLDEFSAEVGKAFFDTHESSGVLISPAHTLALYETTQAWRYRSIVHAVAGQEQ
jgi:hypothetical protein